MKKIKKKIVTLDGVALVYNKNTKETEHVNFTTTDISKSKTLEEKVKELLPESLKLVEVESVEPRSKTYALSLVKFIDAAECEEEFQPFSDTPSTDEGEEN